MALVTVTVPLVPSVDDPEIAPGFPVTAAGVTPVAPSGLSVTATYPSDGFAAWRLDLSAVTAVCPAAQITGVRVTTQSDVTAGVNDPSDGTIVGVYTDTGGPVSLIHSPDYTIATGSDAALLGFDIGSIRGFGGAGSTFAVPGPMDATFTTPAGTTTANVVGVMLIVDVTSGVAGELTQTVTSVEVTYDDTLCPPPPAGPMCADPVTVCNQPAVRVERCHNGAPVLVEYQTDQNGRVLPFNTTGYHGTIRDSNGFVLGRGDQPASGANLWPNTLDNDCGAATPGAPLALNTGGVSIANGVHAATLGPDGAVWNNPGGVRSVTVAARRSATSDANPTGAGSNQVLVGTTLNTVVLLEGETVTWSVDDPDTLNVDWVETFGDSAALVVWTGV